MQSEKVDVQDSLGATALLGAGVGEQVSATGRYDVKCLDADGNLKWEENFSNYVMNLGKANLLNVYLNASTPTTVWYLGLVDNASFTSYNTATDTLASHSGWLENINYTYGGSSSNRATVSWAAAASSTGGGADTAGTGTITSNQATFLISASVTIKGALLCATQARGTTTNGGAGLLYSAGSFATARAVISGDQLLVTYTAQS
jgi:hypothetical protein